MIMIHFALRPILRSYSRIPKASECWWVRRGRHVYKPNFPFSRKITLVFSSRRQNIKITGKKAPTHNRRSESLSTFCAWHSCLYLQYKSDSITTISYNSSLIEDAKPTDRKEIQAVCVQSWKEVRLHYYRKQQQCFPNRTRPINWDSRSVRYFYSVGTQGRQALTDFSISRSGIGSVLWNGFPDNYRSVLD